LADREGYNGGGLTIPLSMANMSTSPRPPRFRDHTNLPLEVLIAALTVLPILALIYFYPTLPDRVAEYLNLHGEAETWGRKGFASVFRLPLMAIDMQVLCLLTKYGVWQSNTAQPENSEERARYKRESLKVSLSLLDWLRLFIAIKLAASSLETIIFSVERFHFLSTATRVTSWATSILGIAGAVFYGYRLLILNRKEKGAGAYARVTRQTDRSHLHGGIFYYNPADASWFTDEYLPNFGNKWVYVFLACLLCLPLLMFWPMLGG
jgi:uncharacterized membrane protein